MWRLVALLAVAVPLAASAAAPQRPVTLLAAGDIATCGLDGDEHTAALLDRLAGTILALKLRYG